MTGEGIRDLVAEMEAIKKLLMLQLLAQGYKQKDLAAALSVSEATLSRMLPRNLSNVSKNKQTSDLRGPK